MNPVKRPSKVLTRTLSYALLFVRSVKTRRLGRVGKDRREKDWSGRGGMSEWLSRYSVQNAATTA